MNKDFKREEHVYESDTLRKSSKTQSDFLMERQ